MKVETLEEAMYRLSNVIGTTGISDKHSFMLGVFWQQERSYSEEDIREAFLAGVEKESYRGLNFDDWFEQFKKK